MAGAALPKPMNVRGGAEAAAAKPPEAEEKTYGQILKSTALVGGSSVVSIAMGIVRTKAMAILLGPAGFGLFGLYSSIANLTQNIAGMGVNSSGVRQIAESAATSDAEQIARTAAVLRRTSVLLGALGAAVLIVFSRQVSTVTFGTSKNAAAVALLSLVVFFNLVSGGQAALIQGLRRISDLARMGVFGALFGTAATIPIVYVLRQRGVVPSLVAVALLLLLTSWWYSRKIRVPRRSITFADGAGEASALLKLGIAFMASGFMTMGSAYLVRIIVVHKLGLEATGCYQSAWTLGGLYIGIILQAMGADFYPRLTASAFDNSKCNRLVNEQAQVGLLLGGPGIIATLTFAPLVITLFYSARFVAAVELLRWVSLGVMLQMITWPMGFIILAQGRQNCFFLVDLAWTVVHVGLASVCVGLFGLNGAGMAFFGSYCFHLLLLYPIVRHLTGFRWSRENRRLGLMAMLSVLVVFVGCSTLPLGLATGLGTVTLIASGIWSVRALVTLIPPEQLPVPVQSIVGRLRTFTAHER